MKRSVIIVLLGLAVLVIFAGIRQVLKSKADLPKSISQLQDEKGVPVEVTQVYKGTFTLSRTYLGTVKGVLQGDVIPSIMEEIIEIPVKVGDQVKKGDVVCRLDTKASIAQYNQLKLAYEDGRREAKRMENLYAAGAISKQMMEKAQLNRDITRQNLESSSQVVSLLSPIDGVITDLFYRPGETTEVGEPVVRVAFMNRIKIHFSVNYEDRKKIMSDTPVFVKINENEQIEIPGKITEISISADPNNRLFSVWAEAKNENGLFQSGLLVDVRVVIIQKPDVTLIPRDAMLTRNEQLGVFVVHKDLRAAFTPIKIGDANVAAIEVIDGLKPGQTVVVYGKNNMNYGHLVNKVKS